MASDAGRSDDVEQLLEVLANEQDDRRVFDEVLEYHQSTVATLPAFHLLLTLRRAPELALYFDSGTSWVVTYADDPDGIVRYRYYPTPKTDPTNSELRQARDLEDLLEQQQPEIVHRDDTPVAATPDGGNGRVSAGP